MFGYSLVVIIPGIFNTLGKIVPEPPPLTRRRICCLLLVACCLLLVACCLLLRFSRRGNCPHGGESKQYIGLILVFPCSNRIGIG